MNYENNYAIRILVNELKILEKILKAWPEGSHSEAKKDRERKVKQIKQAINIISDGLQ